ncbi:LysM peptidoglycan-binding domain-containing protein [Microlunatus speluncae]|uniref:LysM peptidoglycan-binding domain-containing protein n=1 Tax=Microlunatus speluncae TaxID=2594267 RepID=UPI0012660C3F|nr:LysM peptidoglycan-binding domain-containing protein [Microlunatus speluncae]
MPIHRVVAGDDLRSLARRYYGDSAQWRLIATANRGVVGDAERALPAGQELIIPISAADAMDHAAASVRPPYPDEKGATWHVRRRHRVAGSDVPHGHWLRDRRVMIRVITGAVIIALVITSTVLFRAVRQDRLEQDLRSLPGVAGSRVPGKVLDLEPGSSRREVRRIFDTLIELRAYSGTGWTVRMGRAVLVTNVFLTPAAADLLVASGRVDAAGVDRIDLQPVPGPDPTDPDSGPGPAIRISILTDGPEQRSAAAEAMIREIAATGAAADTVVETLSVTHRDRDSDWLFHGRPLVEVDRTVRALQVVARIPDVKTLSMYDETNSVTLVGQWERDRATLCRRAREELAAQPLHFDLRVVVSERREDC